MEEQWIYQIVVYPSDIPEGVIRSVTLLAPDLDRALDIAMKHFSDLSPDHYIFQSLAYRTSVSDAFDL